jgi:hypothetical protein
MNLNTVLKDLPAFTGRKDILIYNQDVEDIIKGILKANDSYASHYRKIWPYFEGGGYRSTARNVWNFLKSNSDYVIEPDSRQTIKTPAAILATAKKSYGGNDCKNFALFSAGVLKAYRDATGEDFNLYFRFAGYNGGGLSHVFTVIEKNGVEIWIDPVLDSFNDRTHEPTKIKDFKINKMALIALSGINPYENDKSAFQNSNPVPGQYLGRVNLQNVSTFVSDTGLPFAQTAGQLINTLSALFASKPNPNDWAGWEALERSVGQPVGTGAATWVMMDGDSVQNEALNIVQWIKNKGIDSVLADNWAIKARFGRNATIQDIADKLSRGGFPQEAAQFLEANKPSLLPGSTKAGTNMFVTIALIGAAAFFLLKKK